MIRTANTAAAAGLFLFGSLLDSASALPLYVCGACLLWLLFALRRGLL